MADENPIPQPAETTELSLDKAASLFETMFDDAGNTKQLGSREEQTSDDGNAPSETNNQARQNRGEGGRFVKAETAETKETPEAPKAPDDWDDAAKEAFGKAPAEIQSLWLTHDSGRREAIKAEQAKFADRLKVADEAEQRIKAAEERASQVQQISEAKADVIYALRKEFSDIVDRNAHLAMSDPNSPKFDPQRAQRFETLLGVLRQVNEAEAKEATTKSEQSKALRMKDMQEQETDLYKRIPEWGKLAKDDMPKLRSELAEVRSYVKSKGIPAEQADGLYHAAYLEIAREAMLYRKAQAEQARLDKEARKKLDSAPPAQKPGAGRQETAERQALDTSKQRLRRTGKLEDAASVFEHFV